MRSTSHFDKTSLSKCVAKLCERELCVRELCVRELCVKKLRVKDVAGGRDVSACVLKRWCRRGFCERVACGRDV